MSARDKAIKEATRANVHRRMPEIGNSVHGDVSGRGGAQHTGAQPREGGGEAGRRGAARDQDRAAEHGRDRRMHSRRQAYGSSGMEGALGAHADKMHPVK